MSARYRWLFLPMVAALAVALVAGCSGNNPAASKAQNVAKAPPPVSSNIPGDEPVARVAAQVSPSVVQVNVESIQMTPFGSQNQSGIGSGVIYRKDGYIITNNHVVEGADKVNVAFADGSTGRGEVVGADSQSDLAVVRVDRDNLPAAKFSGDKILVGQLAVAVGSPSGFQSTVTSGVISGLNREVPPELTGGPAQIPSLVGLIQTDAPISPGNSGGALADRDGEVVGINAAYLPPQQTGAENIGFAIPSATATDVADQLIESGEVSHPYLGITNFADLTPDIARRYNISVDSGVIIQVVPGGPADQAGLRTKDVITAIGSTKVEDSGDLLSALRGYSPGDTVKVTAVRGGDEQTFEVKLGELPQGQQ